MNQENQVLFQLDGRPKLGQAIPLALQHLVAMIVGCMMPSVIIAGIAGLPPEQSVLLIQSGLFVSGIATLLQLYPLFKTIGSGVPIIFGVSFAYVPVMSSIVANSDIATLMGAQLVGCLAAIIFEVFLKKLRRFFPAVVTGTVVVTIGLSLYPTAINYMAGGAGSVAGYGAWQNWLVAVITLVIVMFFQYYTKGFWRLSAILFGIIAGYIVAFFMGLVDFSGLEDVKAFELPQILPFGIKFEPSAIATMAVMFIVNSVQVMGEVAATTSGAMDRMPTDREFSGGVIGNGVSSLIGSVLGGLPTSTFGQNVGIVTSTRIINKFVLALTAVFMLVAGFVPGFAQVLMTVPNCVLGGATLGVFATITMTGIRLLVGKGLTPRKMSIVGISIALGVGICSVPESLALAPAWVQSVFGSSSVVISTIVAIVLNLILPKDKTAEEQAK